MIYHREQFKQQWPKELAEHTDAPLWAYENYVQIQCQYFIQIEKMRHWDREKHWQWCDQNLKGTILCYSCCDEQQWWGFTEIDDIVIWMLKWAD